MTADVEIVSIDPSGDGVARHHGRTWLVPFTIPGERVRVALPPGGRAMRAALVEVLRPSAHRIVARCPHFGPCGGCSWQHIAYPEQLRLKAGIAGRAVHAAIPDAPEARATLSAHGGSDPWGYRQKVHFVFGSPTGAEPGARGPKPPPSPLAMGHYARGSRRIVPVRECPVHDERGNAVAFGLYAEYTRAGIAPAHRGAGRTARGPTGVLKSIAVRVGRTTGELMTTLVVSGDTDKRLRSATRRVIETGAGTPSVHLNLHPRDDGFIFGRQTRRLSGADRLREEIAGASFLISPTAFFQTNVEAAAILVTLVLDAVPPGSTVLDLYAGAGLFALPLARRGHRVVAVEENRVAVQDGEASARLNRLAPDACRFVARRVEAGLASLPRAEAVVLDPPRDGAAAGVLDDVFARLRPRTAVYVSCNPEALGRDLATIRESGYVVASVQPVDMFPHTAHVETVVVLHRRSN